MTVKLDLQDQTYKELTAQAQALGLTVEEHISRLVQQNLESVKEFDRALDELFATDTRELPATSSTYSREDIYLDHD